MPLDPALRYSSEESEQLFAELFPDGWAAADVMRELAPDGWEDSELVRIFHPTPEQQYDEAVRMHENLERLASDREKKRGDPAIGDAAEPEKPVSSPPSLEEVRAGHKPTAPEPEKEIRELVGRAMWDIFSDNHEVTGADGRVVDLGSFRASGGFLAEQANLQIGHAPGAAEERELERFKKLAELGPKFSADDLFAMLEERDESNRPYDYMDFYMGTQMVSGRADLTPVYTMIFRRLKRADCDWRYTFPRLYLFNLKRAEEEAGSPDEPDWAGYDPSAALAEEREESDRNEEVEEMRADLDESYREAVEEARHGPPPTTVAAYQQVYGRFPEGWPPDVEE